MDMSLSNLQELATDREAQHAAAYDVAKSQTRLSDWTELNWSMKLEKGFFFVTLPQFYNMTFAPPPFLIYLSLEFLA